MSYSYIPSKTMGVVFKKKYNGMGVGELRRKIVKLAKDNLGIQIPLSFLKSKNYDAFELYVAMSCAYKGSKAHYIFSAWRREQERKNQIKMKF